MDSLDALLAMLRARSDHTGVIDLAMKMLEQDPAHKEATAAMIDAYVTAPTFGSLSIDEPSFSTWMLRFDMEGLKVMAHATGSLSVRHFLNSIEAVRRANGAGPRHGIEEEPPPGMPPENTGSRTWRV